MTDWNDLAPYEDTIKTFSGGNAEFLIDAARGQQCMVGVTQSVFPPINSAYFGSISDGTVETFANETMKMGSGFAPTTIFTVTGQTYNANTTFSTDNGVSVSFSQTRSMHIGLNGVYDYLDPGETADLLIPYTNEDPTSAVNVWSDYTIPAFDDNNENELVLQLDAYYSTNNGSFPRMHWDLIPEITAGTEYTITTQMRASSLGGTIAGEIFHTFVDASGNILSELRLSADTRVDAIQLLTAPAGVAGFGTRIGSGTRVDFKITSLAGVLPAPVRHIPIRIKGSEDVGPKLVPQDGLSGTSWTRTGFEYAKVAGNTNPLSTIVTTTVGKILQISCNTKDSTAGSITIPEATRGYATVLNDGDVWLVRATSASFTVSYTPTSDFDGVIYDTFVRELVTENYAASLLNLTFVDLPATTEAQLAFKWPVVAGRRSTTEIPDIYKTGVLAQSKDFAYRYDNEEQSAVFENVTFSGTRSGISLRSGGSWVEVYNAVGIGGYTDQGTVGYPLVEEGQFNLSGSGFTYVGWGNWIADTATNDIISAPISAPAGEVMHITVSRKNSTNSVTSGSLIPRLVGDTTNVGTTLLNSGQQHDTYLITVPTNITTIEYVATNFIGRVQRLIPSLIVDIETSGSDKFQSLFASANRAGPQIDDLYMYYCDFDLMIPPMPDNYNSTNTDGIVLARGFDTKKSYKANTYMVGVDIKNISDGGVDGKVDTFFNYSQIFGGHRCFRHHAEAHHVLLNSSLNRHGETQSAIQFATNIERCLMWNLYVDDVRATSSSQLNTFFKANPPVVEEPPIPALWGDINDSDTRKQAHVARTIPRLPAEVKVAMTDMEFEYKLSANSSWLTLELPLVDLPGFVGIPKRKITLPVGVYDFRARCLNAEHTGAWSIITNMEVS